MDLRISSSSNDKGHTWKYSKEICLFKIKRTIFHYKFFWLILNTFKQFSEKCYITDGFDIEERPSVGDGIDWTFVDQVSHWCYGLYVKYLYFTVQIVTWGYFALHFAVFSRCFFHLAYWNAYYHHVLNMFTQKMWVISLSYQILWLYNTD